MAVEPFYKRTDGRNDRPAASEPIHSVMDSLYDLWVRIKDHKGSQKNNNMLEKYDYFVRNSNRGRSCTYAHKCKALFLLSDYEDIKKHLLQVIENIREVPGDENFGK